MSRNELGRLAVAQALYKELGKVVSTKDPRSLRSMMDDELRADYERDGTDRRRIVINGVPVGTLSAKVSKPSVEEQFQITDWDVYEEWYTNGGEDVIEQALLFVVTKSVEFAEWYFKQTGEMPDGCDMVERTHPGGTWMGTTLSGCTAEKVQAATGVLLQSEVLALLEGGE